MEPTPLQQQPWSMPKKIGFLFIVVYFGFLLFDLTSSDQVYPDFIYTIFYPYIKFWHWAVPWTGAHVFKLEEPITVRPNGSGDTTYNYVMQFLWIVLALIIAIVWAIIDRNRPSYNKLYYWLRILVRYYFAYILFVYGFVKVIKLQFPFPALNKLVTPFGEQTPMGLAWSFIGYSKGYNIFIGGAEVVAGVLLFFRKTTLFGALCAMTIMINVAAMNFAYDIPVKIFSVNLVLMSVFIAAHDYDRLKNFFFLNRTAPPFVNERIGRTQRSRIIQLTLKSVFILLALYATFWTSLEASRQYGDGVAKPPLYGIYDVEKFVVNSKEVPPLTTDTTRWKRVIFSYPGRVSYSGMNDKNQFMKLKLDTVAHTAEFTSFRDSTNMFVLHYTERDTNLLVFNGLIKTDTFEIVTRRFDLNKFNLLNRGFHWVNEYPFNR